MPKRRFQQKTYKIVIKKTFFKLYRQKNNKIIHSDKSKAISSLFNICLIYISKYRKFFYFCGKIIIVNEQNLKRQAISLHRNFHSSHSNRPNIKDLGKNPYVFRLKYLGH